MQVYDFIFMTLNFYHHLDKGDRRFHGLQKKSTGKGEIEDLKSGERPGVLSH